MLPPPRSSVWRCTRRCPKRALAIWRRRPTVRESPGRREPTPRDWRPLSPRAMPGALEGRVACITGASRGFGRAAALLFAREGADLVLNYRTAQSEAQAVADEVTNLGRSAVLVQADVGHREQALAIATQAQKAFGRIDVLVNNAGIMDV